MKKAVSLLLFILIICGCKSGIGQTENSDFQASFEGSMPLCYATQFSVDYYEGGYKLITLSDDSRYIVIPKEKERPRGLEKDIVSLYQPLDSIYIAATASACHFAALDRLDAVSLSGTKESGWYIPKMKEAMSSGKIKYAGKYNEPDYELLLKEKCPLAVESLMIGHASDVKKKLNELDITVLTDLSSLEPHPLGRTEWIKLYAALLNEEERASELFEEQQKHFESASDDKELKKTAVFFHISSSGYVVARKSGDYVTKMLELAGAEYLFNDLGDPDTRTSTVNLEMEKFYSAAKDADFIIYNSTIGGEVTDIEQLLQKNSLLADFKAVKEGNVWCTEKNMYQDTTRIGEMIESFRAIFSGRADDSDRVPFLYRLK